jgi:hypothetical protein
MNLDIPDDISENKIFVFKKESPENFFVSSNDVKSFLLGRKIKRNEQDFQELHMTRCDICLEFEKYSESKLIECKKCKGSCHKRCQQISILSQDKLKFSESPCEEIKDEEWECNRCIDLNSSINQNLQK